MWQEPVLPVGSDDVIPAHLRHVVRGDLLAEAGEEESLVVVTLRESRARDGRMILIDGPDGDERMRTVPAELADENADSTFGSLHANEPIEKLAVIPARGFLARLSIAISGSLQRPLPTLHSVNDLLRGNFAEVDMGRRDVRMTELLLDDIYGCVLARQLAGMCVAQTVEMNPLLDSRFATKPTHECPHVALEKGLALQSADDRLATIQAQLSTAVQPALNEGEGSGVEPDRALLAALAAKHIHGARLAVEVFRVERGFLKPPISYDMSNCTG